MAAPPSYEDSTLDCQFHSDHHKGDRKTSQTWCIREQVGLSRTQHVASIVSQLIDHIRDRALQGLSKTTLVLMPSDHGMFARYYCLYTLTIVPGASRNGQVVTLFPNGEVPTMVQLEGRQNSIQFWLQEEALAELRVQMHIAVSDGVPTERAVEQLPTRPQPEKKASWFGHKKSKAPEPMHMAVGPTRSVVVQSDVVAFRSETAYGLYETHEVKVVMVVVDLR
jgi:hypothetical protein